jgi:hypothetical protein
MLARARAAKAAPPEPVGDEVTAEAPAAEVKPAAPAAAAAKKGTAKGTLPTTTADKIAWCRAHDAKSE